MSCFRSLCGVALVLRTMFFMVVAVAAAKDLHDIMDLTSGIFTSILINVTQANKVVEELKLPLIFYIACGVLMLLVTCTFPYRDRHRPRLPYYLLFHISFVLMVVYVVYIHTLVDLSIIRKEYEYMKEPYLFPISLLLDVLTMVSALIPVPDKIHPVSLPVYQYQVFQ